MRSTLGFHGGAGSVTGANFLLDTGTAKIVIDCGAVSTEGVCDTVNFEAFAPDVIAADALIVTHAHADHIGKIPKLVRDGFTGVIYSTGATRDIAATMFDDALGIMNDEAEKHGCDVLYEKDDVSQALDQWRVHTYHEPFTIGDMAIEFLDAGHILGSALIKISRAGRSIMFTGDLGNIPEPLLRDTESPEGVQYLVMESVYGDRLHEGREQRRAHLKEVIEESRAKGGVLLIPSFSVERTQVLLYELNALVEGGEMEPIPIYLDSPLASRVTPIFRTYSEYFNAEASQRIASGDDLFTFPGLTIIGNKNASEAIHREGDPKVIIAGAGMSAGGRIRSHERAYLSDPKTTVLFVGYQAPGSLGRRLQDGATQVTIDGEPIRVRAHIASLTGYSGHADRDQLLTFVEHAGDSLEEVFVTMGETKASIFLAQRIKDFLGVTATVPKKAEHKQIDL